MKSFVTTLRGTGLPVAILLLAAIVAVAGAVQLVSAYLGPGESDADPLADLPEGEKKARQAEASRRSDTARLAVRQRFASSGQDPRTLERTRRMAITDPPAASLQEAVAGADLVIRGTVGALDFAYPGAQGIVTVVKVKSVLKGEAGAEVLIEQVGDLDLDADGHMVLGEADYAPVLFKGDEAVLLLTRHPNGSGRYLVQPWSGQYLVAAGQVEPLPANAAIANAWRGRDVAAFEADLRKAALR